MTQLIPYLTFNENCQEAMEFYQQVLGGKLDIQTVAQSPMKDEMAPELHQKILHCALMSDKITLYASDNFGNQPVTTNSTISLCLNCESAEELHSTFSKLSQGAKTTTEPKQEFFGLYADLTDKYGITWMFQFSEMM